MTVTALLAAAPATAYGAGRPDLQTRAVAPPPATVEQGQALRATATVANRGRAAARPSAVRFYLSRDRRVGRGDVKLPGQVPMAKLKRRAALDAALLPVVPVRAGAAAYYLIACADDRRKVRESNERNNCHAARKRVKVAARTTPPTGVTSAGAIEAARRAGQISDADAAGYQVLAAFGDPRLPSRFRGAAGDSGDDLVLERAAAALGDMRPALAAELRAYFVVPSDPRSWHALRHGASAPAGRRAARAAGEEADDPIETRCGVASTRNYPSTSLWSYFDTKNGKVRVWWERSNKGDRAVAKSLAAAVDAPLWTKLTALMRREPPADDGSDLPCRGGDDRLDVSITDDFGGGGVSFPLTLGGMFCGKGPSSILLQHGKATRGLLAHELMHSFQQAFRWSGCNEWLWWADATAEWATDYVFPGDNDEHRAAGAVIGYPTRSLEEDDGFTDQHRYGAYLWPFFVSRELGDDDFVRRTWEAAETNGDSLAVIDSELATPGGFKKLWPKFALYNSMTAPADQYQRWDPSFSSSLRPPFVQFDGSETLGSPPRVSAGPTGTFSGDLNANLKHLSARHYTWRFDGDVKSVVLQNWLAPTDPPDPRLDNASVQAIINQDGVSEQQDWTQDEAIPHIFCKDGAPPEELTVIMANSSHDRSFTLQPERPPRLLATNISCGEWRGTMSLTRSGNGVEESLTSNDLVFRRDPAGEDELDLALVAGTGTWTYSGSDDRCSWSYGPAQIDMAAPAPPSSDDWDGIKINLGGYDPVPGQADPAHVRDVIVDIDGAPDTAVSGHETCDGTPKTRQAAPHLGLHPALGRVAPDGSISGSDKTTEPDGTTYEEQWTFRPVG